MIITRLKFLQAAAAACYGVINGNDVEITCPESLERCPLGHKQEPSYIIKLTLVKGDTVAGPNMRSCSKCGVLYILPEPPEPSK